MIATRPLPPNDHFAVSGSSLPDAWRPAMGRFGGRDDTLHPYPGNVGTEQGYQGRDVFAGPGPYNAQPGMFRRLHETGGGG